METKKNPAHDVHAHRGLFFLIGVCVSVFLSIVAFQWTTIKQPVTSKPPHDWVEPASYIPVITIQEPEAKAVQQANPISKSIAFTTVSEANDGELTEDIPIPTMGTDQIPTVEYVEPEPELSEDPPVVIAEKMPEPIGGYENFYQQLSKRVVYTRQALRAEVQGKVFVEFIVNLNGSLTDARIVKGVGYGCDEAAREAILQTKWQPGKQRGKPVRVKMILPVYFKMP